MLNTLALVQQYIADKNKENQDGIRIPLVKIAEEFGVPTVTVWRAVQKLKERGIVHIVKSDVKNEPDKIYYIGEGDQLNEVIDNLVERINGILLVLKELKDRVAEHEYKMFKHVNNL